MAQETIKDMLKMIDAKIEHIEDITADNRAIIIKLVKQNNSIVEFLKQIQIEDVTDDYADLSFEINNSKTNEKMLELKELVEEFKDRHKDLKELEDELKKHKGEITPGQIGDA